MPRELSMIVRFKLDTVHVLTLKKLYVNDLIYLLKKNTKETIDDYVEFFI